MLIISKDRDTAINFENVEILGIGNPLEDDDGRFKILANTTSDSQYTLARYDTEERAKEVLKEIINTFSAAALNGTHDEIDLILKAKTMARYEMPKE